MDYLLEVNHLNISFSKHGRRTDVVRNLSINLKAGEILSIVGASGSGKTVFSHGLMGMLPSNAQCSGEILIQGRAANRGSQIGKMTLIPQTTSYLDPLMKVERQLPLQQNSLGQKAAGLYPFQCSGGMIRNALFGLAYEKDAPILIADEPTPGMDLETALTTLAQLERLAEEGRGVILITHDIDLAIRISHRVAVFYDGTVLELANREDFYNNSLRHPYTRALFGALPQYGFQPTVLPRHVGERGCFCASLCPQYSPSCDGVLEFIEKKNGMVRCHHGAVL